MSSGWFQSPNDPSAAVARPVAVLARGVVRVDDAAGRVVLHDHVGRVLGQHAVALFAVAQRVLDAAVLGDVAAHQHDAALAVGVDEAAGRRVDDRDPALLGGDLRREARAAAGVARAPDLRGHAREVVGVDGVADPLVRELRPGGSCRGGAGTTGFA